jgi:hypothetical protein
MGWFLRRRRICVFAALFGLLIQFAASFEHVHFDHIGPRFDRVQSIVESSVATGGAGESTGYVCDVCATLSLAASARVAVPPGLSAAFAFHFVAPLVSAEAISEPSLRVAFRSRAPPLA